MYLQGYLQNAGGFGHTKQMGATKFMWDAVGRLSA
jgi:hypothetical protein